MTPELKRTLKLILGWFFILLGVAGLVLPILQGFLFLAIGLMILSNESARVRLWRMRLRLRYPALFAKLDAAHGTARQWWDRQKERFRWRERA